VRGLSGARDEFHLTAIVQNLKTLADHIWRPWLHPPAACVACASVSFNLGQLDACAHVGSSARKENEDRDKTRP
jgi:hypothetical protein